MFCPQCGTSVSETSSFCPSCGRQFDRSGNVAAGAAASAAGAFSQQPVHQPSFQPQNSAPAQQQLQGDYVQQPYQQQTGYAQQQPYQQQAGYAQQPYQQYQQQPAGTFGTAGAPVQGMKWFKFIIYVQLFLSALGNVAAAILALTGMHYTDGGTNYADLIYMFYPSLKTLDIVYGILLILLAVGAIYVRFQLSGFKKDGPKFYLIYLAANLVVTLIYLIAGSSILGESVMDASTIGSIIGFAVMIAINWVYFNNRKDLFVN